MTMCLSYRHKRNPMKDVTEQDHAGNGWVWYSREDAHNKTIDWASRLATMSKRYDGYDWKLGPSE